jgi:hypothetical protein
MVISPLLLISPQYWNALLSKLLSWKSLLLLDRTAMGFVTPAGRLMRPDQVPRPEVGT